MGTNRSTREDESHDRPKVTDVAAEPEEIDVRDLAPPRGLMTKVEALARVVADLLRAGLSEEAQMMADQLTKLAGAAVEEQRQELVDEARVGYRDRSDMLGRDGATAARPRHKRLPW